MSCWYLLLSRRATNAPVCDVTVAGTSYHGDRYLEINSSAKLR